MLTGCVFRSGIACELRTLVTTSHSRKHREYDFTFVISASAVGVRPLLLLFTYAGTALLG